MLEWVNSERAVTITRALDHVKPNHSRLCLDIEKMELMFLVGISRLEKSI